MLYDAHAIQQGSVDSVSHTFDGEDSFGGNRLFVHSTYNLPAFESKVDQPYHPEGVAKAMELKTPYSLRDMHTGLPWRFSLLTP